MFSSAGAESYYFSQDAFGNELNVGVFTGSSWATARSNGINEHQTGKWIDPFTGLYYFHARWMDPTVGRFVQRSSLRVEIEEAYLYCSANPVAFADPTGNFLWEKVFKWLINNTHRMKDFFAKMCKCGGPVAKQIAERHEKFREQVCKYTDKGLRDSLRHKTATLEEHARKLAADSDGQYSRGWSVTIRDSMEQIAILNEEIARRAAGGAMGCCIIASDCSSAEGSGTACTLPNCNDAGESENGWSVWDYLIDLVIPCEGAN